MVSQKNQRTILTIYAPTYIKPFKSLIAFKGFFYVLSGAILSGAILSGAILPKGTHKSKKRLKIGTPPPKFETYSVYLTPSTNFSQICILF